MRRLSFTPIRAFFVLFTLLIPALLVFPTSAAAQSGNDDQVVIGGTFRLRDGEKVAGNLILVSGKAILEKGSRVHGNVLITGGNLQVSGRIDGNIIAFGGSVNLLNEAVVRGDVNLTSAKFSRSPEATILGDIRTDISDMDGFNLDNLPSIILPEVNAVSPIRSGFKLITDLLWAAFRILALSALAALVVLLAQKPTQNVTRSIVSQPLIASGFGLLTAIVMPALLVLLLITIILIPVSLIGALIFAVTLLFGWIAVGFEIGLRIEKALNQTWAPAIAAGIGTLVLTLIASIFGVLPCIGWVIPALVAIVGLGGVLISRFGTQVYETSGKSAREPENVAAQRKEEKKPDNTVSDPNEGVEEESV